MIEIIPTILAKSFTEFEALIKKVEPYVERASIDVADNTLTETSTVSGYEELLKIETPLKFDVHLMVLQPSRYLSHWYKTKVDRFFIHIECEDNISEMIAQIHTNNRKAGIVLNPDTKSELAIEFMDKVDYVQLMSVRPGYYGAVFLEEVFEKIFWFKNNHPNVPIAVDGGINPTNSKRIIEAGASILMCGSYIMKNDNPLKAIQEMKKYV